ncbi:COX15/CtaA family protein [Akkermansiaceae bacterium]|nr:COX15/CtaA family protein [Akkermansiaceae bacterium]MDA7888169.1 COX15/CtaA family protein [Akkermansiaceae bacterium]
MRRNAVQRLALVSLSLLILLIVAGATVRVTGSGLGCPDWPTCWGQLIPPSHVDEIDVAKIEERIDRYKKSAKRFGRDPDEISVEKLMNEYDPVQTWIEFVNRLLALPTLLAVLLLMVFALKSKTASPKIKKLAVGSFVVTIINALFGIVVVASGLHTGVVTVHMALAFLLLFFLVYIVWAGGEKRAEILGASRRAVMVLLVVVMVEWFMGSQIRELTDELLRERGTASRPEWIGEIQHSWWFLVHRSFSWSILIAALFVGAKVKWRGLVPRLVLLVVGVLMVMGVVLSYAGIHAVTQVLHVGLAGVLVSAVFYWYLAAPVDKGGGSV